jgi:glutathione S-transferase
MVGVSRVAATDAPCRAPAPTRAYAYACGRECDRGPFVTTALRSARAALSATTMLLYDSPVSGNCYKVRLLFAHLGLSYERRECSVVDRSNRAEILGDLNPALRVPTLILDDGRPLAESHAIIWYFAEGSPYLPDERFERAKVLQWLCFEQYDLEPTIAVVRFWVAFSDSPPPAEVIDARRRGGYRALDALERGLSEVPFLVGGRYTLADIALYGYTHVAHEGGFDLAGYPAIRDWLERVAAQPGHVTINA